MNLKSGFLCAAWLAGTTGLLSALLTPLFAAVARRSGVMDVPRERSLHRNPTPLLGGLGIVVALILTTVAHLAAAAFLARHSTFLMPVISDLQLNLPGLSATWGRLGVIFAGGLAICALGLADDLWHLRVRTRLFVQFGVAIAVCALGVRPTLGIMPEPLAFAVAVLWLVGITNAFNLVDGVDGLATGLAAIAACLLGVTMCTTGHPCPGALLFALSGACLGFLWHNWHPARIFLGSAGALFLGYMLGAITMIATFMSERTTWLFPLLVPVLVFAVPLYDTASVILIRLGLKRPVWEGDSSHFHHRLLRIGFSHRQCVAFMWLLATAFGLGGMLITRGSWIASLVVLAQAMVLVCIIVLLERVVGSQVGGKPSTRQANPQHEDRETDDQDLAVFPTQPGR
ncbi:MAG: UDP-N-acetylmuramyl pentapeptide phosphotransferase/UDP-N-acetylglucosamine-1-phosphate [Planctomycetota bacterium]|nr:MAG: UDP-N-acetylmuramyl pentapeptide phosphotransferase/UDP-N-acetylglucosamine-1-phosphate [Planctomycetota bacterium]